MNYRAKEMGYDATKTFEDRLTQLIDQNEKYESVAIQLDSFSIRCSHAICIVLGLPFGGCILSLKKPLVTGWGSDDIIDFILIALPVAS